jgi:NAD-dependent dihydropyrimidine dehydrogenase PreA subunit
MSTLKQFGNDEITVEEMQMLPVGNGTIGTGRYERLKMHSLVLAVGEHADVEFLKALSGVKIGRGDVVEVDAHMSTGHPGVFAGGDMIGGARTMTAAVGHGKKAARNIDAWLRGEVYAQRPKHDIIPFEALNLPVFLDADRREHAAIRPQRVGFEEVVAGLNEQEARYERAPPLVRQLFRVRQPLRVVSGAGDHRSARRFYRYDYDLCTGCAVCFEQCPRHAIEMEPEPSNVAGTERCR